MPDIAECYVTRTLEHLRHLAVEIGARPSAREAEHRAAEYAAAVMRTAGLHDVRLESFRSGRSTYWPYSIALGAGLLGNLLYIFRPGRHTAIAAALLNALGALGFYSEANFNDNWIRCFLPTGSSQNVVGVIRAAGDCRQRVVLVGHLDTHRTPIIYSSPRWLRMFSVLTGAAFASLVVGGLAAGLDLRARSQSLERVERLAAAFEGFALALTVQAEAAPYTAGANDNASGAATVLALGERLAQEPLQHTEVWVANTGCEEVGCYGMAALLGTHRGILQDAYFLDFDMVGVGRLAVLTREGVLRAYYPDPSLLDLARRVASKHPGLVAREHQGAAYTEMGIVIKQGFRGLVVDSVLPPGHPAEDRMGYWHQPQDTYDKIERECLADAHRFGWALLQLIDQHVT